MRRHAKASSARSKARKPSDQGSSSSRRIRLTILLATVAAFLLVPVAQAFANGTMTVNVEGSGNGKVSSAGGFGGQYEGTPPIECSYKTPGPATGVCVDEMSNEGEGFESTVLFATADPGSELAGWVVEEGEYGPGCPEPEAGFCLAIVLEGEGNVEVTAIFACEVPGTCEEETGPTNRAPLTITKSAGGTGGIGSVSSKPKGINCGAACNSAVASMYKNTPVTLTAKPSTGSTFVKWENAKEGGTCDGSASTACTVPMAEAESLEAVFGGTSKAIANPQALTLSKGESSGQGTVKATGLTCELDCTSEVALYQGPTGVAPKNKPGKTVELKALAAYGSTFTGWSGSGCSGTGTCTVTMEEAHEVTATFTAKPTATLTVDKLGTGTGTVTSKPKAISCGTTCTTQDATVPEEAEVILKEKPATGMTFEGWTGACVGAGETCTVSLSGAGTVHAKFGGSPKPILEAKALTLTKAGSGYGTVKGTGLTCEALCASTVSLYQGPTGIAPKNKPGKTVVLVATSAAGSKTVEWTGCDSNPTPAECSVAMESAKNVTATFNEIE